jgi:hypothetical protein
MPRLLDLEEWDHLDPLKLAHAAHLWNGVQPTGNTVAEDSLAYKVFQRLKQEVHRRLGSSKPYPKGYTLVPRARLREIAESWGERPAFLYPEDRVERSSFQATIDPYRTGLPGRPSMIKHHIEQEFRRRCEAGEVCPSLAEEARTLRGWAATEHPSAPTPTEKTIKNNLRNLYRQYKQRCRVEARN